MWGALCIILLCGWSYHGESFRTPWPKMGPSNVRPSFAQRNMFSGIVEDIGEVLSLSVNKEMKMWDGSIAEGVELTVRSQKALEDAYIGCSIAVNGVCLTAISFDHEKFTVGLAPETLRRSNLGALSTGSKVNIERALSTNARNSGHFVQGHVDYSATILDTWREKDSLWIKLSLPAEYAALVVPKGFVALDGTSLTVCEVHTPSDSRSDGWFTIMLVAHTQQHVIFPSKTKGDRVNVEVDVLGKLVASSLQGIFGQVQEQIQTLQKENAHLATRLNALEGKAQ